MKISVEITLIPIKKDYVSLVKKFIKILRNSDFNCSFVLFNGC